MNSNRVNISLSKKCFDDVNMIIEKTHLFNGKSDFAIASIRFLLIDISQLCSRTRNDVIKSHYSKKFIEEIENGTLMKKFSDIDKIYKVKYDGPNISQISIRLSNDIIILIRKVFGVISDDVSLFCKFAIVAYCDYLHLELIDCDDL